ncbi:hypothetical protein ACIA5H_36335 [Nocardia sp. NPDC051900]|uniref:hypothetical protein n=1 Tax=Nocardia sp. NPDC051900 TaxID=3364326 RepID=UPI0037BACACD
MPSPVGANDRDRVLPPDHNHLLAQLSMFPARGLVTGWLKMRSNAAFQVRRYDAWYRHITLAALVHTYLASPQPSP